MMTSPDHRSGTDRLVEVAREIAADVYVNVQGDEPLIRSADLDSLARMMVEGEDVHVGTLCHRIDAVEASNPNRVKVLCDKVGNAIYFSRSPIPYARDEEVAVYLQHVGVYAYRRDVLLRFGELDVPMAERAEKLEQLRLLHAGYTFRLIEVERGSPGVDTPADLARVAHLLATGADVTPERTALLLCDVDGVLTDGTLWYGPDGEELKRFDVKDGLGLKRLMRAGIEVAIVSGRRCRALETRLLELGVRHVHLGVSDKASVVRGIQKELGIGRDQTAAVGDDLPDLDMFALAALRVAPADAVREVRDAADIVLDSPGGRGAVRELAERILLQ